MRALHAGLGALIDGAKAGGELRAEVPSALLTRNLFAIFFQHLQVWLGGRKPQREFNDQRLRDSLELQLSGLRNSTRPTIAHRRARTRRMGNY